MRWQHPSRGLLAPEAFIAIAEETGLIVPFGELVLRKACSDVMDWLDGGLRAVPVAVNISPAEFELDDLLMRIASILNSTGIDASYLELEVTESTVMQNKKRARDILSRLNTLGVKVAIDDFGTGYSALSSLKHLPFHSLKIDTEFVKDLTQDSSDAAITRAIIVMGHGLGLTVVAEGVESQTQLDILRGQDCDEIQGFLVSPAVPSEQFKAMLGDGDPREPKSVLATPSNSSSAEFRARPDVA